MPITIFYTCESWHAWIPKDTVEFNDEMNDGSITILQSDWGFNLFNFILHLGLLFILFLLKYQAKVKVMVQMQSKLCQCKGEALKPLWTS